MWKHWWGAWWQVCCFGHVGWYLKSTYWGVGWMSVLFFWFPLFGTRRIGAGEFPGEAPLMSFITWPWGGGIPKFKSLQYCQIYFYPSPPHPTPSHPFSKFPQWLTLPTLENFLLVISLSFPFVILLNFCFLSPCHKIQYQTLHPQVILFAFKWTIWDHRISLFFLVQGSNWERTLVLRLNYLVMEFQFVFSFGKGKNAQVFFDVVVT